MRRLCTAAALSGALIAPAAASADPVPPGASWSEATIRSADGTRLHADVLRPKGLPADAKTPVIVSVGPYFNRAGETGALGGVQGTSYDPVGPSKGPSGRFTDFVVGAKLMERGYTYVMVDLRGFGGSGGCLDWVGPGEQADVRAAVEWAAGRPWSTGRVGMYGKSYDAVTGLVGVVSAPRGLSAVVAQEPVYDLYRYLYSDGVRFVNSLGTPLLYDAIAATPGPLLDHVGYTLGGATDPACLAANYVAQQDRNHGSAYWRQRDLIARARGARVPLFLTQGFLEDNTKPDGAFAFFDALAGPKRAWFGMWDHVRGNQRNGAGRLMMGRAGWFDEVGRFFDHHVRDVPLREAPTDRDPAVAVQTSDGSWRAEAAWPPSDSRALRSSLRSGQYADDGGNRGTGSGAGEGVWTVSPPLAHEARVAGVPRLRLDLGAPLHGANLVADVYDIDAAGSATLISRGARLLGGSGQVELETYGTDWVLPAGHRVGVLVTGSNSEWWLHLPTLQRIAVRSASIDLPFLTYRRDARIEGAPAVKLEDYRRSAPFRLPAGTLPGAERADFALPPALKPAPRARTPKRSTKGRRLVIRLAGKRGRLVAYGNAPSRARVKVTLLRGKRRVAVRTKRARVGAFRVTFKVRKRGRYTAKATARVGKTTLRSKNAVRRIR